MLRLPLTYTNFNGDTVTKEFFFNLSKSELAEQEMISDGSYSKTLLRISKSSKGSEVLPELKKILKWSYGVRSEDGERFIKNDEVWKEFEDSAAYDSLIMRMFTEDGFAAYFANGIVPADISGQLKEQNAVPGFRPGADTSRPTPPVAGNPIAPMFQQPAQQEYYSQPGQIQHESTPRQTPYDQPNQ